MVTKSFLKDLGRLLLGIAAITALVALPSRAPTKPERQTYIIKQGTKIAPSEVWLQPTHVPEFVFRQDAGEPLPESGSVLCTAKTEFKQIDATHSYPVQYLACENGVKLALTGIDWEH